MLFRMRLPQNKKETALFMFLVSAISVNIIAPVITGFEIGFSWQTWHQVLTIIPFMWIMVLVIVILTQRPAGWLTSKIVDPKDSFASHMVINGLCSVLLISIFMTVLGTWIGSQQISWTPIQQFFVKWPRNFAIALAVELLLAQPIARQVMQVIHKQQKLMA
ncbi:putative membrane protein [Pediococcus damnosus]|uniref:Membrane protein n=1 Tax=Pediococcus damnosus TaxID=51663 RepID=A0A143ASC2_9LACO|nr:hypothetical protein [Pediococcus damnosus]AMV60721.1 putative membrane protein [Pediococcus damnosus]AMV63317.1 putative membrane protein [Pediococcus damnosus]AMV65034.1 putative membrane protein [Pediococcus damnosus]AMV66783.1 putative membrane protein [Pediococcus damnosus]AMV69853.1 putative membrane protein [Pediococcus damnosus]